MSNLDVHFSSKSAEWETPKKLFDILNQEFNFNLDAASTHENALCKNHFTKEDNALIQDWLPYKSCWMNPPYGRIISKFIRKAYEESQKGCIVCCLLPARPDTKIFHECCAKGEVRFLRGRLKFVNKTFPSYATGGKPSPAPFPSVIVIFGTKASTSYVNYNI